MRKIAAVLFIIIIPLSAFWALSCSSEKDAGKGMEISGETTELIRYYQEMKEIGLRGEVEAFLERRDSVTKAEVGAYFDRKGWIIDSAKVSNWAYNWPNVAGMTMVEDSIHGPWRRMVFRQCGMFDEQGREQCIYPMIMWHKDGDQWKVSNASRLAAFRYDNEGNEVDILRLTFHRMFRLPPSFIDLHPKEGPSDIEFHPIKPEDIMP